MASPFYSCTRRTACSGQFATASFALASSPGATAPVPLTLRVAHLVRLEQLRRERAAAVVPLAAVGIDSHSQRFHSEKSTTWRPTTRAASNSSNALSSSSKRMRRAMRVQVPRLEVGGEPLPEELLAFEGVVDVHAEQPHAAQDVGQHVAREFGAASVAECADDAVALHAAREPRQLRPAHRVERARPQRLFQRPARSTMSPRPITSLAPRLLRYSAWPALPVIATTR